jgi:hypothetical protein
MASQFLTTSRLSNIINMIVLGRQSGILRVVRGQGSNREVGQIQFIDGKAVNALLGQVTGANALGVLQNWGECVYTFDEQPMRGPAESDPMGYMSGPLPYESGQYSPDPTSTLSPGGSWPAYDNRNSQPLPSPLPSPSSFGNSYPPRAGSQPGFTPVPSGGGRSGTLPESDALYAAMQPTNAPGQQPYYSNSASLNPALLSMCPRRTNLSEQVDYLPLDRRERMVLLLIDGRRNLSDLARLTRRSEREIYQVLDHLSGLGLIQLTA